MSHNMVYMDSMEYDGCINMKKIKINQSENLKKQNEFVKMQKV